MGFGVPLKPSPAVIPRFWLGSEKVSPVLRAVPRAVAELSSGKPLGLEPSLEPLCWCLLGADGSAPARRVGTWWQLRVVTGVTRERHRDTGDGKAGRWQGVTARR